MKVDILASGSAGNCIAITSNGKTILIDAGIAKTKIEKRLLEVDISAGDIEAIFITHAHGDHIKGLPLANKYKIPVYASESEWDDINNVDDGLRNKIGNGGLCSAIDCLIVPFRTHHDSRRPLGYAVGNSDFKVSVCLDTGYVDTGMINYMKNSNVYVIESNHDPRMVEASNYPESVKARILSHIGHLSNQQTAEALSQLVQGTGEKIYLVHLSDKNNFPSLAAMTTKLQLQRKGLIAGKHYELEVV